MTTLRMKYPQWQGGMNPNYVFGSELLAAIAPPSFVDETVEIAVDTEFHNDIIQKDGIDCGEALLCQMKKAWEVLEEKNPDKVIVFGGDCAVTQVPFDYLKQKYKNKIGILWLDAHPDCTTVKESTHLHEMVMGNLIGLSPNSEITKVRNPYKPEHVLLAGLIEEDLREMDLACKRNNIRIVSPEKLRLDSNDVLNWIEENQLSYIAVHWDLDVLSPEDFKSIYPAEPYSNVKDFPAAVGRMKLEEIGRLLQDVSRKAEIVGLSITEHLPWDAFHLRKTFQQLSIFQ